MLAIEKQSSSIVTSSSAPNVNTSFESSLLPSALDRTETSDGSDGSDGGKDVLEEIY